MGEEHVNETQKEINSIKRQIFSAAKGGERRGLGGGRGRRHRCGRVCSQGRVRACGAAGLRILARVSVKDVACGTSGSQFCWKVEVGALMRALLLELKSYPVVMQPSQSGFGLSVRKLVAPSTHLQTFCQQIIQHALLHTLPFSHFTPHSPYKAPIWSCFPSCFDTFLRGRFHFPLDILKSLRYLFTFNSRGDLSSLSECDIMTTLQRRLNVVGKFLLLFQR